MNTLTLLIKTSFFNKINDFDLEQSLSYDMTA